MSIDMKFKLKIFTNKSISIQYIVKATEVPIN